MSEKIVIERLEFRGRCGVTQEERARPQPLAVDLELECPLKQAGDTDDLTHTIDYARVAHRVVEVGAEKDAQLLESIAERLLDMLFAEFPVARVRLWIRKLNPPMSVVTGSVGVSLDRTSVAQVLRRTAPAPARFLLDQLHRLPKGIVLDVASGRGRHALFLAAQGYEVDAIDRDADALTHLSSLARKTQGAPIHTRVSDLETPQSAAPDLGKETYDAIIVFFYLYRPLFPSLVDALKPGGVLMYETFTIDNHVHHQHPRRQEFCLARNELLRLTSGLLVVHYDEGEHEGGEGADRVYTAQLMAQKAARQASSA
jgi:dihydroneopterin aldolase